MDRGSIVNSAHGAGDNSYPAWGPKSQVNSYNQTTAKKGNLP